MRDDDPRQLMHRVFQGGALLVPLTCALLFWLGSRPAFADIPLAEKLRLQPGDDEVLPLQPVKPRTPEQARRLESLSWFMTGRLAELRNENKTAFEAYRKAIELDPQAAEAYRAIVPLAFNKLDLIDDAVKYAVKGVELLPEDHELLRLLGIYLAQQRRLPEAIRYLKQASDSPQISKASPTYVLLMRELGILYAATGQTEPAADAYTIIFDALTHPEKYELDLRIKSRLLAEANTSYERIGQILLDGKRIELASQAFEQAAKTGRTGGGKLVFYQAKVLFLSDKPDEALESLQKYFDEQRQSKGREAYLLLAEILRKLNRGDELIGRLEQLAEKDPKNTVLQYFLAEQLVAAGELEKAKGIYETALDGNPDAAGYLGLSIVYRKLNRPEDLLNTLGRALSKVGPENLEDLETEMKAIIADEAFLKLLIETGRDQHRAEPPRITFEKSYLLAKMAAERKLIDDSAEFYRVAMLLNRERLLGLYTELGELYYEAERFADAAKVYGDAGAERTLADRKPDFLYRQSLCQELSTLR